MMSGPPNHALQSDLVLAGARNQAAEAQRRWAVARCARGSEAALARFLLSIGRTPWLEHLGETHPTALIVPDVATFRLELEAELRGAGLVEYIEED
jgi:hypothetical protein